MLNTDKEQDMCFGLSKAGCNCTACFILTVCAAGVSRLNCYAFFCCFLYRFTVGDMDLF